MFQLPVDQEFEVIMKSRFGKPWAEFKDGAKTTTAYMDFMGKVWDDIKISYSIPESQRQDQYLRQLDLPNGLVKMLDDQTKE